MTVDELSTLIAYNFWAHRRVWGCIEHLTDDQFVQDVGYSFGSVRNQVVHLINVDERWLARISGAELPDHIDPEAFPTRAAVRERWDMTEAKMRAYLATLRDADLSEVIEYDMPHRGGIKRNARWQILVHVVNHGTDHRAQILAMLHQLGASTTEQDLMFYLWE